MHYIENVFLFNVFLCCDLNVAGTQAEAEKRTKHGVMWPVL